MCISSFDDFNFYLKIDLYEKALKALASIKIKDSKIFKEELARRYENLGDTLPLYRDRILREIALTAYKKAQNLYNMVGLEKRALFIEELIKSDELFMRSVFEIKLDLRRKFRLNYF